MVPRTFLVPYSVKGMSSTVRYLLWVPVDLSTFQNTDTDTGYQFILVE
jgi:hypothetical protein